MSKIANFLYLFYLLIHLLAKILVNVFFDSFVDMFITLPQLFLDLPSSQLHVLIFCSFLFITH